MILWGLGREVRGAREVWRSVVLAAVTVTVLWAFGRALLFCGLALAGWRP